MIFSNKTSRCNSVIKAQFLIIGRRKYILFAFWSCLARNCIKGILLKWVKFLSIIFWRYLAHLIFIKCLRKHFIFYLFSSTEYSIHCRFFVFNLGVFKNRHQIICQKSRWEHVLVAKWAQRSRLEPRRTVRLVDSCRWL